jgi:hypothetical protein
MRRTLTLTLMSLFTILAAACAKGSGAGEAPASQTPASAENPCAQPASSQAGETPACTGGCKWNGTECRQERGIIVQD